MTLAQTATSSAAATTRISHSSIPPALASRTGGQDFVDGGAGRDLYYGDAGGVINLDQQGP